jgi:hypothetical protein
MPDDNVQATDDARNLRVMFPRWDILLDPLERAWVAVRGRRMPVAASSPEKLSEKVEAAARSEAGPDEGDKTQTWRTLRNHGRGWRSQEAGLLHEPFTLSAVTTGYQPGFLFCD